MSSSAASPSSMEGGSILPGAPVSYPYRALLRKSATLQRRQKKTNCCQICCPVTGVIFIFLLQLIVNSTTSGLGDKVTVDTVAVNPLMMQGYQGAQFVFTNNSLLNGILMQSVSVFNSTILPRFYGVPSSGALDALLFSELQAAQRTPNLFGMTKRQDGSSTIAVAAVDAPAGQDLSNRFSHSIYVNNNTVLRQCSNRASDTIGIQKASQLNGFGSPMMSDPCAVIQGVSTANLVHTAFLRSQNIPLNITTNVQAMPLKFTRMSIAIAEILGTFFFPMMAYLMCPVFLFLIVLEKQERLREFSKMNGMRMRHYWLVTFLFDYSMYLVSMIMFFFMCGVFQFRFVLQTNPLLYLSLYFLWGINLVVFAIFLSTFLGRGNTATIFGYALVLISSIAAPILELFVFSDTPDRPFLYMMYPFFAFCHGLIYLLTRCVNYRCLQIADITSTDPFSSSMGWLFFDLIFFLALGLYLDLVLPSKFGVRRHPLFCFPRFNEKKQYAKMMEERKKAKQGRSEKVSLLDSEARGGQGSYQTDLTSPAGAGGASASSVSVLSPVDEPGEVEDIDVRAERLSIENGEVTPDQRAVFIKNLRKIYSISAGKKIAVRDLCLSMKNGECFALLGPNGAGKTTTISILTGLYPPTSGEVYVCGYDVGTQRNKIHLRLGTCPQFDCLWESLSPREHLLFYARLKGVPKNMEMRHTDELLAKVGLGGQIGDKPSGTLSGGMKRRLSIAIALVGDPSVVFLDEPSTGLDPTTRRHLWDIIAAAKKGRCILLTTHAMDEAETLCDRIAIMSLGRLKCLGSPLQLKARYGAYYRIAVSCVEEQEEQVQAFLRHILPTGHVVSSFAGTLSYEVPRADVVLSQVFKIVEEQKANVGIRDWGLSQTSLEDVFLGIVRNEEITPEVGASP